MKAPCPVGAPAAATASVLVDKHGEFRYPRAHHTRASSLRYARMTGGLARTNALGTVATSASTTHTQQKRLNARQHEPSQRSTIRIKTTISAGRCLRLQRSTATASELLRKCAGKRQESATSARLLSPYTGLPEEERIITELSPIHRGSEIYETIETALFRTLLTGTDDRSVVKTISTKERKASRRRPRSRYRHHARRTARQRSREVREQKRKPRNC